MSDGPKREGSKRRLCERCHTAKAKKKVGIQGRAVLLCAACFAALGSFDSAELTSPRSPRSPRSADDTPSSPRADAPSPSTAEAAAADAGAPAPALKREKSGGLARFVPKGLRKKKSTATLPGAFVVLCCVGVCCAVLCCTVVLC